jgi:hypothetical protein
MIDQSLMRIQGHVLSIVAPSLLEAYKFQESEGFKQASAHVQKNGATWASFPLDKESQKRYAWLYHKMKGINGDDSPRPPSGKPPKGSGPNNGGSGGTPSAGSTVEFQNVQAIAA